MMACEGNPFMLALAAAAAPLVGSDVLVFVSVTDGLSESIPLEDVPDPT